MKGAPRLRLAHVPSMSWRYAGTELPQSEGELAHLRSVLIENPPVG